jgi:segregation and condensation protein A
LAAARADRPGRSATSPSAAASVEPVASSEPGSSDLSELHAVVRRVVARELDVLDVALAEIVTAYRTALDNSGELDLDRASEFALLAAAAIERKAALLVPAASEPDLDEEVEAADLPDRLLARRFELEAYARAADWLGASLERAALAVPRRVGLEDRYIPAAPDPLAGVTPEDLAAAMARLADAADRAPEVVDLSHVAVEQVTVEQAVAQLLERLPEQRRTTFAALSAGATSRVEVIVRLLALLELAKRGLVELEQSEPFGTLEVAWVGPGADEPAVDVALAAVEPRA